MTQPMRISLVVAMSPQGLIGAGGKLPWHQPEDLRHFRSLTLGHSVVMGRKTFESIGKALPDRRNLVISHQLTRPPVPGIEWVSSLEEAIDVAWAAEETELMVIGGAQIYALALPRADRLYLTRVHLEPPPVGDTYFPAWDPSQWCQVSRQVSGVLEFLTLDRVGGHVFGLGPSSSGV